MSHALRQSARIRAIAWRDLTALRPAEQVRELLLPLPFLIVARAAFALDVPLVPWLASAYFFLAGLRLVHDAFHDNLALSRPAGHAVLVVLSGAMLGSMHAVRLTHLQHHRHSLGPDDVEGQTARGSGVRAIGAGLAFPFRLHRAAWRRASRLDRRFIAGELLLTAALLAIAATQVSAQVSQHVALMAIAQGLTGFFAVWTVHHDVDEERQVARTLRHRVKSAVALGMFFHLEHHLFPRVPTCHLPRLADRLDDAAPELSKVTVY
ncbi:MAG: fatty acid desaturase [Vicinamibacteraceae bacterium]